MLKLDRSTKKVKWSILVKKKELKQWLNRKKM